MILIIKCRSDFSPFKTRRKSLELVWRRGSWEEGQKNLRVAGGGVVLQKKGCLSFDTRLLIKTNSILCKFIFIDPLVWSRSLRSNQNALD